MSIRKTDRPSRDHYFLANIISKISKKVNSRFRKASRGIAIWFTLIAPDTAISASKSIASGYSAIVIAVFNSLSSDTKNMIDYAM